MIQLYHETAFQVSKRITNAYSTSFSFGIKMFSPQFRDPIYAVYSYVRLADEIVDSFHGYNKAELLERFRKETYTAIDEGISTNPVLHAFQLVVKKYDIDRALIDAFLNSMEMDLSNISYRKNLYESYIYGSAESVGLMCLKIFVKGDSEKYNSLKHAARMLGSAFQKVNFLRDIRSDIDERGRIYLPDTHELNSINNERKKELEKEAEEEFNEALIGIMQLPHGVRLGVYSAYMYYNHLFRKIRMMDIKDLLRERVRVPNPVKIMLLFKSYWQVNLRRMTYE